jgi:sulfate transport system ATP-binding protein
MGRSLSGAAFRRPAPARGAGARAGDRARLLLLDEPFGALDAKVRKDLRRWLRELHTQMGLTSIFVTHDQEEALEVADRVVVMNNGVIEQVGTPEEIYMHPATPFVALRGRDEPHPGRPASGGARDEVHFRPHDVEVVREGGEALLVDNVFRKGGAWRVEGALAEGGLIVEIDIDVAQPRPNPGETVLIRPVRSRVFNANPEGAQP